MAGPHDCLKRPQFPAGLPSAAYLGAAAWGAGGTTARYLIGSEIAGDAHLPLATFLINVCGAFLLGLLLERLGRSGAEPECRQLVRLFAGTGWSDPASALLALPHETTIINLSGSLLLGHVGALAIRQLLPEPWHLMIGSGFLGAHTTFSTASVEMCACCKSGTG